MVMQEADRNLDGKVDYVARFSRDGTIELADADDDFDGTFESTTRYRLGNPQYVETDTDGDGFRDFRSTYENGVLVFNEYLFPSTGLPEKIEYLTLGKVTHSETDIDRDGKMDKRSTYNGLGDVIATDDIR